MIAQRVATDSFLFFLNVSAKFMIRQSMAEPWAGDFTVHTRVGDGMYFFSFPHYWITE